MRSPAATGLVHLLHALVFVVSCGLVAGLTAPAYTLFFMTYWSCTGHDTGQGLVASTEDITGAPAATCAIHLLQAMFFVTCVGMIAGPITPAHIFILKPLWSWTL